MEEEKKTLKCKLFLFILRQSLPLYVWLLRTWHVEQADRKHRDLLASDSKGLGLKCPPHMIKYLLIVTVLF